jgi:hypothetical protein
MSNQEDRDPKRTSEDDFPFAQMSAEERRRLNESIDRGLAQADAGQTRSAADVLNDL